MGKSSKKMSKQYESREQAQQTEALVNAVHSHVQDHTDGCGVTPELQLISASDDYLDTVLAAPLAPGVDGGHRLFLLWAAVE